MTHTPTPWRIEDWHGDTQITGSNGDLICIDTTFYPVAPSIDDMNHIVKCVNMYDALVEALRELLELTGDPENDADECESVFVTARETLKKAGAL